MLLRFFYIYYNQGLKNETKRNGKNGKNSETKRKETKKKIKGQETKRKKITRFENRNETEEIQKRNERKTNQGPRNKTIQKKFEKRKALFFQTRPY
jgi:hypothetical protein